MEGEDVIYTIGKEENTSDEKNSSRSTIFVGSLEYDVLIKELSFMVVLEMGIRAVAKCHN